MKNFISDLEEILEKKGSIRPDDTFRDYDEWDSLAVMGVSPFINDEFDITLPRAEFEQLITVKQLFEYIKQNS